MKNRLKIILNIAIFTIIICASVVYAENETVENTTNTTNTTTNTTENTVGNKINENTNTTDKPEKNETPTNTVIKEEKKKSSNANLKNLGIKPNDFKGFKPEITTYKAEVPNNVSKVEVYAKAQDTEAEVIITGTGNRTLKVGENELIITVTAEDGTQKTYTIYVTRLEENLLDDNVKNEKDNIELIENKYEEGNGLASITFGNASMEPEFQTNIYEYQVKYIGEETTLDIKVEPTDSSYIVQITGNENLQEGENIITILVSDKDDNNVATYQLTVNKKLVDEEAIAREKEAQKKALIIGVAVGIVLITVVVIIIKLRKNKKEAEEYEIPFSKMNFEKDKEELLEEKEMSKEEIRKNYLESYNSGYEEDSEIENKKIKSKGKRFK